MTGMIAPFSTTCANHTGHAGAWMLEWDGAKFVKVVGPAAGRPSVDRRRWSRLKAKKYADANAPWPMNDECKM